MCSCSGLARIASFAFNPCLVRKTVRVENLIRTQYNYLARNAASTSPLISRSGLHITISLGDPEEAQLTIFAKLKLPEASKMEPEVSGAIALAWLLSFSSQSLRSSRPSPSRTRCQRFGQKSLGRCDRVRIFSRNALR